MKYIGIVQKGGGYGQTLGFPTANIPMTDTVSGIYAARILSEGNEYKSVVYANVRRSILEAHILDFDGDLYGKEIEIELLEKIRDDMTFAHENEAREVIAADVTKTRERFKNR